MDGTARRTRTDNGAKECLVFWRTEDVAVDDLPAVFIGGVQEVLVADHSALLNVVAREVLRIGNAYAV